jgi:hypothetical protein
MTLEQIAVFQGRILADITKGRIAPREASALDRALRKRLKATQTKSASDKPAPSECHRASS